MKMAVGTGWNYGDLCANCKVCAIRLSYKNMSVILYVCVIK
jgi:hypothetical protein